MKSISKFILFALVLISIDLSAQSQRFNFFDELTGNVRPETEELDVLSKKIIKTNHRSDDVVWGRVLYRIVDLRDKQNFRLYFPSNSDVPSYRNLFRVILDAVCDAGVPAYERGRDLKPLYVNPLSPEDLHSNSALPKERETDPNAYLIDVNELGKPVLNMDNFSEYSKDVLKYVVQEIVFFNKHTSRVYRKVIGLAPLYSAHPDKVGASNSSMLSLQYSILFWVLFDELRPHLAQQYLIPNGNEMERLTYDDFFAQRLYSSYLLGDNNLYNRLFLDYETFFKKEQFQEMVVKEQKRIEDELLNFEQDLWEY